MKDTHQKSTKIIILCVIISQFLHFTISAQSIANKELENIKQQEFNNYTGRHDKVDSANAIRSIGVQLQRKLETSERADFAGKYRIQRVISPNSAAPDLFDADILILTNKARVDHVRNLRLIIAAYLQAQYGYDQTAAKTISIFITYYNAFYRKKLDYFSSKYKPEVLKFLDADKVGLSLDYQDWPGATQIVIPLVSSEVLDQKANPDLDETGKESVSELLDDNEPPEISEPSREKMIELREKKIERDRGVLEQKQKQTQKQDKNLRSQIEKAQSIIAETDNLPKREEARRDRQQAIGSLQQNQEQQEKIDRVQKSITQREEKLSSDKKTFQESRRPKEEPLPQESVVLLPAGDFYQFNAVDNTKFRVTGSSKLTTILNPDFVRRDGKLFATAQTETGNYLLEFEPSGLELVKTSEQEVSPLSGVWELNQPDLVFSFVWDEKTQTSYLASFSTDLKLIRRSSIAVNPLFRPQVSEGRILVINAKNQALFLNKDLEIIGTIQKKLTIRSSTEKK